MTTTTERQTGELGGDPTTPGEWIDRARRVAGILAGDAAQRDRDGKAPYREVELLKESGLVTLLGPAAHGGGGETWTTALRVCREVSKADGSVGQLLGYHYLWSWATRFFGTEEQIARDEERYTRNRYFYGGAINPRDKDIVATDEGDALRLNGGKSFASGSLVSDLTCLTCALEDGSRLFVIVDSKSPGLVYNHDWDNMGQRLTESGSITATDLIVPWNDAIGDAEKKSTPMVYGSLSLLTLQLVMTNLYLGIAEGAMESAAEYTRTKTRPWPYGGDDKDAATDEWYILEAYGDFRSKLWAAEALIEQVNERLSGLLHGPREAVTMEMRGETAVRISAAKQRIIRDGLDVCTRVFEVMGARSTSAAYGFDRFWRNLRTHSLHDPVAYKAREVGRYTLLGELPQPSFYT
ncbi:acyl-CoA dehydrogenase family protein [Actinomadura livida]|uniref:Acyl-CoA dehydrogenase family protein n=1 Tax=Actinomadura livida TaxID=79909 RepID=A0A7W7MYE8_9ACTN|nr:MULTISPECIES: acyl-CoA dehydrogenase family protein [Actinomadura]MBB4774787.1 alkylation response protein AidB-like acyl-CoA dehydrogenase [Actinomadura catellatispora]GGU05996.1 FMNH2-dependent monooxygenase [Actinomadura livida]